MPVYGPNPDISSNASWNFPLIVEVNRIKTKYTPNSNVALQINKFYHLILEVNSNQDQLDCNRMLLQAGCLARLSHALSSTTPFIVSAVYITESLVATWYLVYKPRAGKPEVCLILQKLLTTYTSAG